MAEARNLKQREYHTDVLSHPDHNVVDYGAAAKQRYTNTNRSNVFHYEPDHDGMKKQVNKREGVFKDNPLATKVARASYQDSNIFGTKSANSGTIQASETADKKALRERAQNTYNSQVFTGPQPRAAKERTQNTYNSNIFGGDIVENAGRKRIGGWDSGTNNLFGDDNKKYEQSSANGMIQATSKKVVAPEPKTFTAADLKDREIHGEAALKYGTHSKKDGGLMCAGGDWKNTGQQATNASSPQKGMNMNDMNRRDKKYQQLQSSVFGGGYQDKAPIEYDHDNANAGFGTNADWKTQGGQQKPNNTGSTNVDTFRQRQKQLHSNVFGDECQTDYTGYMPLNKKGVDIDNLGAEKTTIAKGRKIDNEFKQRVSGYEKVDQNYQPNTKKQGNLASSLFDRPISNNVGPRTNEAPPKAPSSYNLPGRESKATKQAMLASNDPITGASSMGGYQKGESSKPEIIELTLSGLGSNVDARDVKKMAGVRHVVSATVDEDNMKGTCLGTGKVKVRLNQGETRDQVELNFTKNGIAVREAANDPRKKPALTGPPKEYAKEVTNTKNHKQGFLATSDPGIYNTGSYQVQ